MTSKSLTFFLRLASTITLWIFVLAGILSGYSILFFFLIAGLALAGLWEYFSMLKAARLPCFPITGMVSSAIFLTTSFLLFLYRDPSANSFDFELAAIPLFVMLIFGRQMLIPIRGKEPIESIAYTLFGIIYIPWLFNFLEKIVYLTPLQNGLLSGQNYVLYLVVLTKFTDMGAYLFGVLFGKHPAIPHISPHKTWEGFAGAFLTVLFASWLMHSLMPEKLALFRPIDLFILPLLIGLGAIIGDLAESLIKRSTQTKDSSHILPGIGGTLDLIDSVLFTAPILYFYLRLVVGVGS